MQTDAKYLAQKRHRPVAIKVSDEFGDRELLDALNSGDPERSKLVQWVDECLATGRDETGAERPALRQMPNAGTAWHGLANASNHLLLRIGKDGRPMLTIDIVNELKERPKTNAALLVGFWLTGLFTTVARCRECGCYFLLRQANRIKPYKPGTYCEEHQKARHDGKKARSTTQLRDNAKATLFTLAATKFGKDITTDSKWFENARLRDRMVDFLNQAIDGDDDLRAIYRSGGRDGITIKWLAYASNRAGIATAIRSLATKSRKR